MPGEWETSAIRNFENDKYSPYLFNGHLKMKLRDGLGRCV